jgi:hypothetical protein
VERIVELAMSPPPAGRSRWTTRLLAKEIGLTSGCVEHLAAYMQRWNKKPTPFAWTKPANAIIESHRRMLDRISTAVP